MTKGRKPKAAALHLVGGNASGLSSAELKRRLEFEKAGLIPRELPAAPDVVEKNQVARAEWNLMGPLLAKYGVITELDRTTFSQYCMTYARWIRAEQMFAAAGDLGYTDTTPNGFTVQSVLLTNVNRLSEQLTKLGDKLGLSPDSRAGLLRDIAITAQQGELFGNDIAKRSGGQAATQSKAASYF